MCGIAGIVGERPSRETVERMTHRLAHRGPDDSGLWSADGVCFGHTRLSILDLSPAGHQPMSLGPITVTYNGEIYNFRELRRELPGPFVSECDTEVLLHLYERDGDAMVRSLHGMFAFAIWDGRKRRLLGARDRLGIKPFFYRERPDGIEFASEIKALLESGRPDIDRTSLRDYFSYKYVPAPKTIYSGIRQLPPGHVLVRDARGIRTQRYWEPETEVTVTREEEAVERLGSMLETIVPEHTLADVPVGVFLSGGIDSTTVVAHLERPRTFTLGTDVKRRDESGRARRVARHFDTRHHEEVATSINLDEALETISKVFDEPFGDSGAWATYLVSRMARRQVKVTLSGEGGDELFCGYHWYTKWPTQRSTVAHRALALTLPAFSNGARSIQRRAATGLERYAAFLSAFTLREKHALLTPELLEAGYDDLWHFRRFWREDLEPLKRMQWVDLHGYLAGDLMMKIDRASMAHSLEVRPPLLDHRLVELALSLDTRLLRDVKGNRGKLVVRSLMNDRVPPGQFDLEKRGFNLPIRSWVRNDPGLLEGALRRLADTGIIRRLRRPTLTHEQTWSLLILDRWLTVSGAA
jgi:asparagine synthase (glutamine-hydrolysing)